jgi:hypothetical protein
MKLQLAVVMRKDFIDNPWQSYRWVLDEVVYDVGQFAHKKPDHILSDRPAMCMRSDETTERWLYTGFEIQLYKDEAEGYYLNSTSTHPAWFVMWRLEDHPNGGGETVENVPLDSDTAQWLSDFVMENYKPEPKKRARPASFKGAHRPKDEAS